MKKWTDIKRQKMSPERIELARKAAEYELRKPLTRRLLAATSDVMQSARHAEGNDAGHTRGQEATKAHKGGMA